MLKASATAAAIVLLCLGSLAQANITIDTVAVGNKGNTADTTGYGSVGYGYDIGKYEVTAGQYTAFLNAVGATDTYALYNTRMLSGTFGCNIQRNGASGSYSYSVASDWANRPVNYVSWGDSARFANWLHNGQPTGAQGLATTEDGAYFLNGATTDAQLLAVNREADWKWAITSEDEWYKAAYYDPNKTGGAGYWLYPTKSNVAPSNVGSDGYTDPGNHANYDYTIGSPYYQTIVGEFENSASAYGTFDQGGSVWEYNEAIISGAYRGHRGASFASIVSSLQASVRGGYYPSYEFNNYGFRVSQVPEPSSIIALLGGLVGLLGMRRRRA